MRTSISVAAFARSGTASFSIRASVVTHVLGVSSGDEFKHELGVRNQRIFSARWRHEFAGRPSYAESRALPAAFLRDLSADARLLMLPGRKTDSCRDLAMRLVTCLPDIRVTVLGDKPAHPPRPVEWISAASPSAALRDRRFTTTPSSCSTPMPPDTWPRYWTNHSPRPSASKPARTKTLSSARLLKAASHAVSTPARGHVVAHRMTDRPIWIPAPKPGAGTATTTISTC